VVVVSRGDIVPFVTLQDLVQQTLTVAAVALFAILVAALPAVVL
jgi:hypothetical protein